jgi:hypothetical protein
MIAAGATDVRISTWRTRGGQAELTDQLSKIVSVFRTAAGSATNLPDAAPPV